ncbi:MAG: sensor signal transduction histidine kinase, partial [Myxococcaceae bacterium]|nr:sensor signal transduction histidine kinase [Myxococcaceae bacterium]
MNPTEHNETRLELAEAMPHIVWTQRPDGRVTYFNRRWTEYTGRTLAEALAEGAADAVHPDDRPELRRLFAEARAGEAAAEATYRLRRGSDGSYRWH